MILQILNIAGGAVLASEKIATAIGEDRVTSIKEKIAPYEARAGVLLVLIGLIGLIERLSVFHTGLNLGSSFPQVLPLIAVGLCMAAPILEKNASLRKVIAVLRPYEPWIGILAIACGLGSLLFGCMFPICYSFRF